MHKYKTLFKPPHLQPASIQRKHNQNESGSVFFKDNRSSSAAQAKLSNMPTNKNEAPVQLNGLDKLSKPKIRSLGEEEVAIQDKIMNFLNEAIEKKGEEEKAKAVFRLCTVELTHGEGGSFNLLVTHPVLKVPQGLTPGYDYIKSNDSIKGDIAMNVYNTLLNSGQLEYIKENNLINDQWRIIVDVDFYYSRPPQQVGFHKDTVGRSLFVNLNFNNEETIPGPEYILNPEPVKEHDQHIGPKLPKPFLEDLVSERSRLGSPGEIGATIIPKKGSIGFVDELIHHSTPYLDHRGISSQQLDTFLSTGTHGTLYNQVKTAYRFTTLLNGTSKAKITSREDLLGMGLRQDQVDYLHQGVQFVTTGYMIQKLQGNQQYEDMKKLVAENPLLVGLVRLTRTNTHYDKKELMLHGMSQQDVDALFNINGKPDMDHVSLAHCEDHCDVNTENRGYPVLPYGRPKLRRQMSELLLTGRAPKPVSGKRQFFRTWVQAIPKNMNT